MFSDANNLKQPKKVVSWKRSKYQALEKVIIHSKRTIVLNSRKVRVY